MTTSKPETRGGPRPNSGRPSIGKGASPTVMVSAKLTAAHREKFRALGGSAWLRRMIEVATLPPAETAPAPLPADE